MRGHVSFGPASVVTPVCSGIQTETLAGNSLAAPQVAGAAALILSHDHSLRGNPIAIRTQILNNADQVSAMSNYVENGRRLNVHNAVNNGP